MSYMKLIKLLYLADREALARWGRPITTDSYVSMKHGPVLSEVLNLITDPLSDQTFWARHISEPEHFASLSSKIHAATYFPKQRTNCSTKPSRSSVI